MDSSETVVRIAFMHIHDAELQLLHVSVALCWIHICDPELIYPQ